MLMQTLDDAALIALIPAVALALRRTGMPVRFGTAAMVVAGMLLVCLADVAGGATEVTTPTVAGWILTGLIDGLAAAGLTRVASPPASTPGEPTLDRRIRRRRTLR